VHEPNKAMKSVDGPTEGSPAIYVYACDRDYKAGMLAVRVLRDRELIETSNAAKLGVFYMSMQTTAFSLTKKGTMQSLRDGRLWQTPVNAPNRTPGIVQTGPTTVGRTECPLELAFECLPQGAFY
jgi:hypothetical protein